MLKTEAGAHRLVGLMGEGSVLGEVCGSNCFGREFNIWYVLVLSRSLLEGFTEFQTLNADFLCLHLGYLRSRY